MRWEEFKHLISADLYRYHGELGFRPFLRAWRWEPGFRITFWMRFCRFLRENPATRLGFYHVAAFFAHRINIRFGVYLDMTTEIGGGLFIPHPCSIIVNRRCRIGRNCNLSQGVTIGVGNRGPRQGIPTIGDNVYIGPNAVIFGAVNVGDDVAVGANSVVTKDAPDGTVVAGAPARVISEKGSRDYVNLTLPSPPPAPTEDRNI